MKIALIHDDFMQAGGAESLFATIAALYPQAPIYTSLVDWSKLPSTISPDRIHSSFLQKIPLAKYFYKGLLPFYPLAFESFDFSNFDLAISSTTRFAKAIITKPGTIHICYANSVPRFLWVDEVKKHYLPSPMRLLLAPIISWMQRWDKVAAKRVDYYIANSQYIKDQLKQHYSVDSQVIYPFADLNFFKPAKIHNWQLKSQNYYLVVSRLVKWKKIEIAIEAAKELNVNLKIVGTGPDEKRLKDLSKTVIPALILMKEGKAGIQGENKENWIPHQVQDDKGSSPQVYTDPGSARTIIEFLGKVTSEELLSLYQNAKALIVTQQEDFGIAAVEAQACGLPVIAYSAGGQQEIIINQKTGIFFDKQNTNSLSDAIQRVNKVKWKISPIRLNAARFSKSNFIKSFKKAVNGRLISLSYAKQSPRS